VVRRVVDQCTCSHNISILRQLIKIAAEEAAVAAVAAEEKKWKQAEEDAAGVNVICGTRHNHK